MNRFQVNPMKQIALIALLSLAATAAMAKLPVLSEEAKTKAVEAAAKAAHGGKVDAYKLCQSMDRVAAAYQASAKKAGKDVKPATTTPACADPGPFVSPSAAASAPATAVATAPAAKK